MITATASRVISKRDAPELQRQMREALATQFDDPELALQSQGLERWTMLQNTKVDDTELGSRFLPPHIVLSTVRDQSNARS